MQAHRVESTLHRLQDVKGNLKEAEQILIENIADLRSANPDQKPKGTAYARRMLRSKPLWQKVVSAHTLNTGDEDCDTEEDSALSKALKDMSPLDAKIEFERHDYTVSYLDLPTHLQAHINTYSSATSFRASKSSQTSSPSTSAC